MWEADIHAFVCDWLRDRFNGLPLKHAGKVLWIEPYPDALLEPADPAPGPESHYESRETISFAFITALQQLPPRQREAVVLRYYGELSEAQTAAAMGCSVGAVKSHTSRANASASAATTRQTAARTSFSFTPPSASR